VAIQKEKGEKEKIRKRGTPNYPSTSATTSFNASSSQFLRRQSEEEKRNRGELNPVMLVEIRGKREGKGSRSRSFPTCSILKERRHLPSPSAPLTGRTEGGK